MTTTTHKTPVLILTALTALLMHASAAAAQKPGDFIRPSAGCPSDAPAISFPGNPNKYCRPKNKSSKRDSSGSSGSSGGAVYVAPSFGEVAKINKTTPCPSGYVTDREGEKCTSPTENPLTVTLKKGACPSGTVEEWGAYCTQAVTDNSDDVLDRLDRAYTADFNVVYVLAQVAGVKPLPDSQVLPGAFAAAKAARAAAANPWQPKYERERAAAAANAKTPAQLRAEEKAAYASQEAQVIAEMQAQQRALGIAPGAGMPGSNANTAALGAAIGAAAAASTPQDAAKDAAKAALGGALKGLFGR